MLVHETGVVMTPSSDRRADTFAWPAALYADSLGGADRVGVFRHNPTVKLYREILARHVRRGMAVLDLGCGHAIGGCHLAAIGGESLEYVGVDANPEACARAREVLGRLPSHRIRGEVVCSDADVFLSGATRRFDLVLCNYGFQACLRAAAGGPRAFGERMAAALDADSLVIVADVFVDEGATAEEIVRIHDYAARAAAYLRTGVHEPPGALRPAEMDAIFREAGLHIVERHEAPWFALSAYEGQRARYALRVVAKAARRMGWRSATADEQPRAI
jgi:SAM-dependent methyltransferase